MSVVAEGTPGARAIAVTHLVHPGPPPIARAAPKGTHVDVVAPGDADFSSSMYARVGAPWHWVDRLDWSQGQWQEWVESKGFRQLRLMHHGQIAGYAELTSPHPDTSNIAYFGLLPDHVGKGLGAWWLERVTADAWAHEGVVRVTVNTCELDHPSALPNYMARGFVRDYSRIEWRIVDE
jgi:GNAT superfamily N-acetyltransferase